VWSATIRDTFKAQSGKYTLLDMKEDDEDEVAPRKVAVKHVNKDSKLPQELQVFVRKIYAQATGNLKRTIDCEFTSKGIKTPLGVLSLAQVGRGDEVLERIQAVLEGASKENLEQLSSEYYTLIPHAHGRVKPKVVNNKVMLKEKQELSQLMKG
jgi:poly [ADP-ribose] polymerase